MVARKGTKKSRTGRKKRRSYRKRRSSAFKWKLISALSLLSILTLAYLWYFGHFEELRPYLWALEPSIVSDQPSHEEAVEIDSAEAKEILIYFGNSKKDSETLDCSLVFPVKRKIGREPRNARVAIEALLQGPTPSEKAAGYYTSLNRNARLDSLGIEDRVAIVNFDESFARGIAGACQVQAIKAQVIQTVLQFDTVDSVQILVEGKISTAFQP